MSALYRDHIKKARLAAGLTQEQAAECCAVSIESWRAYEYGHRLPPPETVTIMAEELRAAWLALEYMKITGGMLGVIESEIPTQGLSTAVITLINRVFAFADHHRDRQLLAIAEDGVISRDEEDTFAGIVHDLDQIIGAALAVKFPIKKETAPTRARRSGTCLSRAESDCISIIPRTRTKSQALPGGEVSLG